MSQRQVIESLETRMGTVNVVELSKQPPAFAVVHLAPKLDIVNEANRGDDVDRRLADHATALELGQLVFKDISPGLRDGAITTTGERPMDTTPKEKRGHGYAVQVTSLDRSSYEELRAQTTNVAKRYGNSLQPRPR